MELDHQHQAKHPKSDDILDFYPASKSPDGNFISSPLSSKRVFGHDNTNGIQKKRNFIVKYLSEKELKIRDELESEIERCLEEEIKDGIYHLAVRLHRLYQQQKERNNKNKVNNGGQILEVNISIKMEGGTKIEIKEVKKEAPDYNFRSSEKLNKQLSLLQPVSGRKKFDWANTLRSDKKDCMVVNKRNGRVKEEKKVRSDFESGWKF